MIFVLESIELLFERKAQCTSLVIVKTFRLVYVVVRFYEFPALCYPISACARRKKYEITGTGNVYNTTQTQKKMDVTKITKQTGQKI